MVLADFRPHLEKRIRAYKELRTLLILCLPNTPNLLGISLCILYFVFGISQIPQIPLLISTSLVSNSKRNQEFLKGGFWSFLSTKILQIPKSSHQKTNRWNTSLYPFDMLPSKTNYYTQKNSVQIFQERSKLFQYVSWGNNIHNTLTK